MEAFLVAFAAFICSTASVFLLRPVCEHLGHMDKPGGRKTHTLATPLCGGLAIALGIIVVGVGAVPSSWQFGGFAFGLLVLLFLGAMDDRRHVPAVFRLLLQTLAVSVGMCQLSGIYLDNLGALTGGADIQLGDFGLLFTVFAAVGIINAVNMIDGMDGLAGGFALMVVSVILVLSLGTSTVNVTLLCLTIGSVVGFLVFNLRTPWQRQARVFLGDAGSLVLGYILVWFAIESSQGTDAVIEPITAVWLVGLPLADTAYLMMSRIVRGKSPLSADRYHFHHLLQRLGLTPGWALYTWLAVAAGFMVVGLITDFAGLPESYRCFGFVLVFAAYAGIMTLIWRRLERRVNHHIARIY